MAKNTKRSIILALIVPWLIALLFFTSFYIEFIHGDNDSEIYIERCRGRYLFFNDIKFWIFELQKIPKVPQVQSTVPLFTLVSFFSLEIQVEYKWCCIRLRTGTKNCRQWHCACQVCWCTFRGRSWKCAPSSRLLVRRNHSTSAFQSSETSRSMMHSWQTVSAWLDLMPSKIYNILFN